MFTAKKTKLFDNSKKNNTSGGVETVTNPFVKAALKKSAVTKTGNGAVAYKTTGNDFVDQFGTTTQYLTPRSFTAVDADMRKLWGQDSRMTVVFIFFLRMITRVVDLAGGLKTQSVQRGAGLRHEGNLRMLWLAVNEPNIFWKNIQLYISIGSWRDIIQILSYDLQYNGWKDRVLDWDKFGNLLLVGLENPAHTELIKKWLPQIKSNSKCNTIESQADNIIAKWICSLLYGSKQDGHTYKKYRKLKSSGKAHTWQQLISQKKFDHINFDSIHGKALTLLASSKFLKNNGLEAKYEQWIDSKPVAKFTGYVTDLILNLNKTPRKPIHIKTFNAQFKGLIETAKKNATQSTRFITVVDTSGSMGASNATKLSNMIVAKAMALFFANMLDKGPFAKTWYNFGRTAVLETMTGATPYDQWISIEKRELCCDTNFEAVVNHLCAVKKSNPQLSEEDFPNGFLVLSDMEFNSVVGRITNTQALFNKLKEAGFSQEYVDNFKLVYWHLTSSAYNGTAGKKFENYGNVKNVFNFSGYDGSIIAFLTGLEGKEAEASKIQTSEDLFNAAMDQEVMQYIEM